ncbi:unnamed protein product [Camellia sinensis]
MKGIQIEALFDVFEESPQNRRAPPLVRVEKMFEDIQFKLLGLLNFFSVCFQRGRTLIYMVQGNERILLTLALSLCA